MRCQTPGKICEGLWYLGHPESGVYLLDGSSESIIISGGTSYIVPALMCQLEEFGLSEDRISGILILHAHFDHIGIIPFFRKLHPGIRVYASDRAWQILGQPRNIITINEFSHRMAQRMGMADAALGLDWPDGLRGETVYEGTAIHLGNIDVLVMETPGHSSCSVSAYVPQLRALFPSDGGGIPYKGRIFAAPNSNFLQYRTSLQRMEPLDIDYICADHFGYVHGDEARSYLARSIQSADEEFERLSNIYEQFRDVEIAAKEAASSFLAEHPDYFLTPDIYEGICGQMMKQIARLAEA